ncbi:MAG: SIS domain-containing protein [Nitrospirota bacterium]
MDILKDAKRVLTIEQEAIKGLIDKIDDNFIKAVDILLNCKGRVIITGMGKSGLIGRKISATLSSTGTPTFFLHPAEGMHGDLGIVTKDDVVIAISYSGNTEELISMLPFFRRFGIKVIAMTSKKGSHLAKNSDIFIDISVNKEACPLGITPTASTTATLAMGDALAVALLKKRGFKKGDFALFHPGGSIGKSLLLRVDDLMHKGERHPVVVQECLLKDAIYEMTSKGLGMTSIVNKKGILVGILTDGDLRRILEIKRDVINLPIKEVMTKRPKTIRSDRLAAEALQIMESYAITSLVVIDKNKMPCATIHLHDILKAGVA